MRILPWVVTALVLAWILKEYSFGRIVAELRQGDTLAALLPGLVTSYGVLVLVAAWDTLVFHALGRRLRYRDVLGAKAATSMLQVLGYGFGQGGYGVWLARRTGTGIALTAGTMLYIACSDLVAVCVVATAAAWFGQAILVEEARALVSTVGTLAPCIAGGFIGIMLLAPWLLRGRRDKVSFWQVWLLMSPGLVLANVFGRVLNIATAVVCTWWGAQAFGLDVPFTAIAVMLPLALIVGSLPVNVAGFGAVQAVWLLLVHWGPTGEQVLAFNFVWHLLVVLGLVLRGLPFLRRTVREIAEPTR